MLLVRVFIEEGKSMTEKKKTPEEAGAQRDAESKVSTGAWWKSALNLLPGKKREAVSSSPEKKFAQESDTAKDGGAATQEKSVEHSAVNVDGAGDKNEKKQSLPSRPKRGRRGPRQKPAASKGGQEKGKDSPPDEKIVTKLLINAEEPEECRIALVENGRLESFHVASVVRERTKNNIYKGKIVAIEANLQAAFVEIGGGRNGFLPFESLEVL